MVTGISNIDGVVREFNDQGQLIGDAAGINAQIVVAETAASDAAAWSYDPLTNTWQYTKNGHKLTNTFFTSNVSGANCWYAVDTNGNMLTGLVKKDGAVYYLQENGAEAGKLMACTTVNINGVVFETDAEGKIIGDLSLFGNVLSIYDMDKQQAIAASVNANGEVIPIIENMANTQLVEGFVHVGNGVFNYIIKDVDATGKVTYRKAIGIVEIGGYYYYFDENGTMAVGLREVDGTLYYFCETGHKVGSVYTGYISVGGASYYCDPANGGAATRVG